MPEVTLRPPDPSRAQRQIERLVVFARLQKEQIVKLVAERNRYRELYFRAMAEKEQG